jgi:PAS domain-containing protein
MTARQTDATTDPRSIIAVLQQRLDATLAREATLAEELAARTAEPAQRDSEYSERIEQQSATNDVLRAISASLGDVQPVIDLITRRAQQLCNSRGASIFEYDGELVHLRTTTAFGALDPVAASGFAAVYPMTPTRGSIRCRAILDKRVERAAAGGGPPAPGRTSHHLREHVRRRRDETQRLIAWNRNFQDIFDVPDKIIARRQTFPEYVRYLAERGEYGTGADPEEQVRRLGEQAGRYRTYERIRPDGRVIEIRHNLVPGGGFVLIYADITERKRSYAEIRAAHDAAEEASRTFEAAYRDLKAAQRDLGGASPSISWPRRMKRSATA